MIAIVLLVWGAVGVLDTGLVAAGDRARLPVHVRRLLAGLLAPGGADRVRRRAALRADRGRRGPARAAQLAAQSDPHRAHGGRADDRARARHARRHPRRRHARARPRTRSTPSWTPTTCSPPRTATRRSRPPPARPSPRVDGVRGRLERAQRQRGGVRRGDRRDGHGPRRRRDLQRVPGEGQRADAGGPDGRPGDRAAVLRGQARPRDRRHVPGHDGRRHPDRADRRVAAGAAVDRQARAAAREGRDPAGEVRRVLPAAAQPVLVRRDRRRRDAGRTRPPCGARSRASRSSSWTPRPAGWTCGPAVSTRS